MKPASLLVPFSVDVVICAAAGVPNVKHDAPANVPHPRLEATQTNPGTILSPVPAMPGLCLFPCPPAGTCACTYRLPEQRCTETGFIKTNTTSYQLVYSAAEITDYASGSKPSNWNTCWKVDATLIPENKPFFRDGYEFAISDTHKMTAILDVPGIMVGRKPTNYEKPSFKDIPDNLVSIKEALRTGEGASRTYFSDYLVKKVGDKWRIYARFDFSLTWNARDTDKKNFTLRFLSTTTTTSLLDCHKAALIHKTMPGKKDE